MPFTFSYQDFGETRRRIYPVEKFLDEEATLVVFVISIFFVIYPVSISIRLPYIGKKRIPINLTTAPILAIAILWAAQCLGPSEIRDGIVGTDGVKPYNILILFFSLAYMAITLDITGVLQAAAFWVSNKGGSHGYKLFFYFYLMLTALSVLLGNDPVILSGTAFLVYYTKVTELNPMSWLMSEFVAANTASMVLFVGNPTNVVICEGFSVNNAAFTAYTILPFLACSVAGLIALGFQFRKSKYIPRRLANTEELDVRSVLLDPIGAWVGSFLLGFCLIVIIIVSFFHVDVWKISLPFAVTKFFYDIAWDHYRWAKNIPMLGQRLKRKSSADIPFSPTDIPLETRSGGASMDKKRNEGDTPQDVSAIPPAGKVAFDESALPTAATNTRVNTRHCENFSQINPLSNAFSVHCYLRQTRIAFPHLLYCPARLPFALVPFAFSQFILIEGLAHQGWIEIFANWLVRASHKQMHPVIWLIGVLGVVLCNISGTNIGATILLTKIVRAAVLPPRSNRAAAISLAVASNIGAVSFTFSASLAGLLWKQILQQKGIFIKQRTFAYWNTLPLIVMTVAGLAIVSAEMAVLYPNRP
ncbi:putative arsenical pump membrane protein [Lyophyllum shimeji]|uniref:Arsenical pump membrane protein n=1 Tax=Lyophyllum shimeji TaxID=47721 RepID=A0A9P3PTV6_LYOSH|nr:putative arsenical pump membrane protein [Lyophyllum shimeji]